MWPSEVALVQELSPGRPKPQAIVFFFSKMQGLHRSSMRIANAA